MGKKTKKRWPYNAKLIGNFTDIDLDVLEKLAHTARTNKKKYQKDLLRIVEFATNQFDYRPGVYLVKFLVCYGDFGKAFTKTYEKIIFDDRWKAFCKKFGEYVLNWNGRKDDDYETTVVAAYRERHPNN